jgi:hypothetical protein
MKKRVKFTDIILTEQELKFNKAFKKRTTATDVGLILYIMLLALSMERVGIATLSHLK